MDWKRFILLSYSTLWKTFFSPIHFFSPNTLCSCRGNSLWSGSETTVRPWMRSWKWQWTDCTVWELEVSHSAIWWRSGWSWGALSANHPCFLRGGEGWVRVKCIFPWEEQQPLMGKDTLLPQSVGIGSRSYKAGGDVKMSLSAQTGQKHGKECVCWSSSKETRENLLSTEQPSWLIRDVRLVKDHTCIMKSLLL